ncbi:MAG: protein phosphatase CheZ [bacterium]|nr:protein phosphatase CheZ [bacterium]
MFVDSNNRCSVSKEEFLESFVQLYHAIKDYEGLLTEFSGQDRLDPNRVQAALQERINGMQFAGLNVRAMEMLGAYLRSTLDHYQGEKLNFYLPQDPDDDYFKTNDGYAELSNRIEEVEADLGEIQEKIFYITRLLPPKNIEKLRLILKAIASFFKAVVRKDFEDIETSLNHLHHLTANRESFFLINEIGRMVRGIHNSLQDFSEGVPTDKLDPSLMDDMPDAIDKLNLVIQRMESAANSTLDQAESLLDNNAANRDKTAKMLEVCGGVEEELLALAEANPALADQLHGLSEKLHNGVKEELLGTEKVYSENEAIYFEIIGNQSFQDLTGQTLKKIISFIEQLEFNLLSIIQKYSGKMPASGAPTPAPAPAASASAEEDHNTPLRGTERDGLMLEGPQDNNPEDLKKQADIDKMLAEFGF